METKKCTKCGEVKSIDNFAQKTKTTRQSYCRTCQAEYRQEHYKANKAKYVKKAAERNKIERAKISEKIAKIKDRPCTDCGQKFPHYVMDFDHVDNNKEANVSRLAIDRHWEAVLKEIDKCELVCSNCHRIRTWNRQQNHRLRSG